MALRDHLLAPDAAGRAKARQAFDARRDELDRLLRNYADTLVSDDRDRRSARRVPGPGRRMDLRRDGSHGAGGRRPPRRGRRLAGQRPRGRLGRACQRCPPRVDRAQPGPGRDRRRAPARRQPRGRTASHLRRSGPRAAPVGRSRPDDLPEDRGPGPRAQDLGGVHRGRRFRRGRALHPRGGRDRGPGALDRRLEARGRGHGGPALGQVQRGHAHRQPARGRDPRRVRRAAALGPRAGARWGSGSLPHPGGRRDAAAAGRPLRPVGVEPEPRSGPGSATGSSASARAKASRSSLAGLPPDYLRIASGLGGAAPTQAMAWPLASQRRAPRGGRGRLFSRARRAGAGPRRGAASGRGAEPAGAPAQPAARRSCSCRRGTRPRSWRRSRRA